jgi:hypothetical protein
VSDKSAAERRAHQRMRGPFDAVQLGLLDFKLRLHDLSPGGCLVESLADITTEHSIRLRIALPDGNSVTVRGQVKLPVRDIGYSVRFIDVDDRTTKAIEDALEFTQLEREPR